jgi:hypothetical protein
MKRREGLTRDILPFAAMANQEKSQLRPFDKRVVSGHGFQRLWKRADFSFVLKGRGFEPLHKCSKIICRFSG